MSGRGDRPAHPPDDGIGQLVMPLGAEPPAATDGAAAESESKDQEEAGPYFESLEAFVAGYLAPAIRRKPIRRAWCPMWWGHPEAVLRLMALWQAWEAFRLEGGPGMSSWWIYHADHHLGVLFDPESGPFAGCRDDHTDLPGLACEPMPTDLAADLAEAAGGSHPAGTPEAYAGSGEDEPWDSTAVGPTRSAGHG